MCVFISLVSVCLFYCFFIFSLSLFLRLFLQSVPIFLILILQFSLHYIFEIVLGFLIVFFQFVSVSCVPIFLLLFILFEEQQKYVVSKIAPNGGIWEHTPLKLGGYLDRHPQISRVKLVTYKPICIWRKILQRSRTRTSFYINVSVLSWLLISHSWIRISFPCHSPAKPLNDYPTSQYSQSS